MDTISETRAKLIWQMNAMGYTPRTIADKFAKENWDVPREVETFSEDGHCHFTIKDGTHTFQVVFVGAPDWGHPAFYQIWRLEQKP